MHDNLVVLNRMISERYGNHEDTSASGSHCTPTLSCSPTCLVSDTKRTGARKASPEEDDSGKEYAMTPSREHDGAFDGSRGSVTGVGSRHATDTIPVKDETWLVRREYTYGASSPGGKVTAQADPTDKGDAHIQTSDKALRDSPSTMTCNAWGSVHRRPDSRSDDKRISAEGGLNKDRGQTVCVTVSSLSTTTLELLQFCVNRGVLNGICMPARSHSI